MQAMTRWRAVPTTVWSAVGALAFLASAGLAVVLGAGLHVWSGPLPGLGTSAHPARAGGNGVVTVAPPPAAPAPFLPGTSTAPSNGGSQQVATQVQPVTPAQVQRPAAPSTPG